MVEKLSKFLLERFRFGLWAISEHEKIIGVSQQLDISFAFFPPAVSLSR